MFRLQQVSKSYEQKDRQVVALRPVTLEIDDGQFVAVVGPSGSGKTTLLSILGGMLAPTTGKVWLDGKSLYEAAPRERARVRQSKLGFVFQTFNLIPYLSALENVQVPLMLGGVAPDRQLRQAALLLERVGLAERVNHKPSELSTGQQQRVALARTLANDPRVILADEPTGNLDPATRQQVLDFLQEFCREGRIVIVVTHDPAVALRAGRQLVLSEGHLIADTLNSQRQVA
jgi:putative ABC transport system ATP-binding protein